MSLAFSDTTNKSGIIQHIERMCGFNDGEITGNTTRMAQFTSDVNLALDNVWHLILRSSGTWQFDDSNHDDYPILTANIVASQQDYSFTADDSGNLILDIHKVQVKDTNGDYRTLTPLDQQTKEGDKFANGDTGSPLYYDKTANGIFLYPTPDSSVSAGIQVFVNREASYFATSDTTKKAGFAGIFHRYLVLHPSHNYAMMNGLSNRQELQEEKFIMEQRIADFYGRRSRDEKPRMIPNISSTR